MNDEKLEIIIGNLLRTGVLASALIVLVAGVIYVAQHHADRINYAAFQLERSDLRTVTGILHSAGSLRPDAMIQLGLLLLIATPVARVAFAAIGFFLEGDRLYVAVSAIVLLILLFSLLTR
jgi:uncharacterized membrane protein